MTQGFKLRLPAELRAKIDVETARRKISLHAEVLRRLEESFVHDRAFRDPEMSRLAYALVTAFQLAAQSRSDGKPGWAGDRECYLAGMDNVIDLLVSGVPDISEEEAMLMAAGLKSRIMTRALQRRLQEQERMQEQKTERAA